MVNQKRLFLTGGSGLLALNWALLCCETWDVCLGLHTRKVLPTFVKKVYTLQPTLQKLLAVLSEISPHVVVNTAAATNVEYCELHPEIAFEVNVVFAELLARACNHLTIPMVHLSTDHLFDGLIPFATEDTPLHPLNVYARTKAEAETRVMNVCSNALVIRTNFYGWGTSYRYSITDKIIQALQNGNLYTAFSDVYFTPIFISDLVKFIHELIDLGASGVFHVVGDQRLSKYDFGLLLAQKFGFQSSLLRPISIHDVSALVKRPKDMSLCNRKSTQWLNRSLGSAVEGLVYLKQQMDQGYHRELLKL